MVIALSLVGPLVLALAVSCANRRLIKPRTAAESEINLREVAEPAARGERVNAA